MMNYVYHTSIYYYLNFFRLRVKTGLELLRGSEIIKKSISIYISPFICFQGN
jgi:hypothetical protein